VPTDVASCCDGAGLVCVRQVVVDKAFKDAMHVNSSSLTQTVSACNSLDAGARAEMLGPKLREMDSAMVEEVKARVLAVGLHGHGGGGGNGAEASGVAALRETLRQLQHAVGGASPAKVRETAREAKEETGRMRAELESVQQEAAAAEARAKEEGASPGDDNKPASAGRRANRTSNSEFSPGMARSSLVDGSNAESRRAKQSEGTRTTHTARTTRRAHALHTSHPRVAVRRSACVQLTHAAVARASVAAQALG
jgi:hypothetical protein